ncbi:hypothetical protein EHS25_004860 [Saitozyma podzolica]|uniref:Uncharacterized protein n=1 Tax=Saitozyma podzolica TaxID=1890683 RepID=A0A427Y2W4_9TREE|nr:hypothetical protein EHS25_004860 [Saitozyma podzolica]
MASKPPQPPPLPSAYDMKMTRPVWSHVRAAEYRAATSHQLAAFTLKPGPNGFFSSPLLCCRGEDSSPISNTPTNQAWALYDADTGEFLAFQLGS